MLLDRSIHMRPVVSPDHMRGLIKEIYQAFWLSKTVVTFVAEPVGVARVNSEFKPGCQTTSVQSRAKLLMSTRASICTYFR